MRWPRRRWKVIVLFAIVGAVILRILSSLQGEADQPTPTLQLPERLDPTLTLIFQDFELFENNVTKVVSHLAQTYKDIDFVVISKWFPLPPLNLPRWSNVRQVVLENGPYNSLNDSRPDVLLKTNFVLFMPDNTFIDEHILDKFRQLVKTIDIHSRTAYAVPVGHNILKCHGLTFSVKTWTLEVGPAVQSDHCGYVTGDHGILMQTKQLSSFADPFIQPTFMSLYIQSSLRDMKFSIASGIYLLENTKPLFKDPQSLYQHKQSYAEKLRRLYVKFGVKLVIRENGKHDWYGCSKETYRCFDIYHETPDFVLQGKWTPPCCLKALRETVKYVFGILEKSQVRFWLEGGSLLGAARSSDIIPWDYDVDIGIYQEDIVKCTELAKISQEPFIDADGYSWERAIEGDFYRVQYSETNHLHVDIFPFFSRDGVMTKNTWMKTHRQDTEFPEKYLKPLTKISFAGVEAPAPNHVKDFLEYKFGKGVIDSPKYPNGELVP